MLCSLSTLHIGLSSQLIESTQASYADNLVHLLQTDAADGKVDWKTQAKGVFTDIKVMYLQWILCCYGQFCEPPKNIIILTPHFHPGRNFPQGSAATTTVKGCRLTSSRLFKPLGRSRHFERYSLLRSRLLKGVLKNTGCFNVSKICRV